MGRRQRAKDGEGKVRFDKGEYRDKGAECEERSEVRVSVVGTGCRPCKAHELKANDAVVREGVFPA